MPRLVQERNGPLFPADALAMPGAHNRQNLLVTAAARRIGLDSAQIETGLRSFTGVPHRLNIFESGEAVTSSMTARRPTTTPPQSVSGHAGPGGHVAGGQTKQGDATFGLNSCISKPPLSSSLAMVHGA